jgi:hypothetical protein
MATASTLADRQRSMRERYGRGASIPEPKLVALDFQQRHYTVTQISEMWGLSADATRKLFENEPGVLVLAGGGLKRTLYKTLRIPERVVERVYRRQLSR